MLFAVRNIPLRPGLAAFSLLLFCLAGAGIAPAADKKAKKSPVPESGKRTPVLWKDPADVATRDLYFGAGGKEHEPRGPFKFVKEDLDGTNPKFVVTDASGVKWKVKLGLEARPETAASRLVWAAGYFTNEDYFVPDFKVEGMQKLRRGARFVSRDGSIRNVRLKREPDDEKKAGIWRWQDNPFAGTPELNGLRTLMALINNWDLKDVNNAVYKDKGDSDLVYLVSDLGASFGAPDRSWPAARSKDNLRTYSQSRFIRRSSRRYRRFSNPGCAIAHLPSEFPGILQPPPYRARRPRHSTRRREANRRRAGAPHA